MQILWQTPLAFIYILEPKHIKVTLETIDIEEDGNEEWFNKFRYEIPVFFFNKKFLCKNRIDMNSFQSALEEFHSDQKKWWQQ